MSVQTENLMLGLGELYFKRVGDASSKYMRVGTLKGNVQFSYEMETVEQKPGNKLTVARRDKVGEKATLTASVCDFKVQQLIAAMGLSISTTQLTLTQTIRVYEEMTMGSVTLTKTLAHTMTSLTNFVAESADRQTKFVRGTAYSLPAGKATIAPLSAAFANKTHLFSYDTAQTVLVVKVGDKTTLQKVALKYTGKLSTGKYISIEIPIATVTGGLTIPFGETEYTVMGITFAALGDMTAASGSSLFKIMREV